ncbi:glycosyltransferase [Bradyrhizobium sp. AC87j1]|uniref:glycosyltransferase n=1 Tax=Bradyrhizobium sp. AC87j1 TaxID=2055894 RepID=UPI001FE00B1D|nr:glycosyltransferase [Bradyrhizobium sp. AC87j1]
MAAVVSSDVQRALFALSHEWYVINYGLAVDPERAAKHYLEEGRFKGYDPNPYILSRYLLRRYPDFYAGAGNVAERFLNSGYLKRHEPSKFFANYVSRLTNCEFLLPVAAEHWLIAGAEVDSLPFDPYVFALAAITGGLVDTAIFSIDYYSKHHPDVRTTGMHPHHHFIVRGYKESRNCSTSYQFIRSLVTRAGWFDPEAYAEGHPKMIGDSFQHYLVDWRKSERNQKDFLDFVDEICLQLPRLTSGQDSLITDTLTTVTQPPSTAQDTAGRSARPEIPTVNSDLAEFDANYYLAAHPDVKSAGVDPYWHYVSFGEREGRKPNPNFDPKFYLATYGDVRRENMNAFEHYRQFGRQEGRLPAPPRNLPDIGRHTILFVGHDSYAAGAQKVLLEIIRWFRVHTHYRIRILLLGPGHLCSAYAELGRCFSVNDIELETDYIISEILCNTPDVVYLNTVISGRVLRGRLGAFVRGAKIIAHCHEMEKVLSLFPAEVSLLTHQAHHWISASPAITEYLVNSIGIDPMRVATVPAFIAPTALPESNWAEYRLQQRLALGISEHAVVVLGCGTLHWRKDPAIFVETAITLLRRQELRKPVVFLWIGDGEDLLPLRRQIDQARLSDSIKLIGWRSDASDLMAVGDIFLLSSLEDPFPLVVLEAAQFGIPALCFRHATGMEALIGRGCGLVMAERSATAAAEAIAKLAMDDALRRKMGDAVKEIVRRDYVPSAQMLFILAQMYNAGVEPGVSVVVPSYNHERFIDQRLQSIFNQTFQDFELIVLDDHSTDDSVERIRAYAGDPRMRFFPNETNSGAVFLQWAKGVNLARSELIWIAESDDFCNEHLLSTLTAYLQSQDVMIAFCETNIVNEAGEIQEGALRPYFDRIHPGFGTTSFIMDGSEFVNQGYGALSVIVNASGAILRRTSLQAALPLASRFKMCGDWIIYLECCRSGVVAYDIGAKNYFRRHAASTVHKIEGTDQYFAERLGVAEYVLENFHTSASLQRKMRAEISDEAQRFAGRYDSRFTGDISRLFAIGGGKSYLEGKVHVCFYVHGMLFSKGGIERLFAMLSAGLIDRGYRVSVVCKPFGNSAPVYPLRRSIDLFAIDITTPTGTAALRQCLIDNVIDVFVPMLSEDLFENAIDAAVGLGIPIIASEHNDPWMIEKLWWSPQRRRDYFSKCNAIHLLTHRFRDSLPNEVRTKARIIPNPVAPEFFSSPRQPVPHPRIIAAGRLEKQKRFDLLISAFAQIADKAPNWELVIFGEGQLRDAYEELIGKFGLGERVWLPGPTNRLAAEMARSQIFVLSSEFEGLPLTLIEAMAAGTPSVTFRTCQAVQEIIQDGSDGFLVDEFSADALAAKLSELITTPDLREQVGRQARQTAMRFELSRVVAAWDQVIRTECLGLCRTAAFH